MLLTKDELARYCYLHKQLKTCYTTVSYFLSRYNHLLTELDEEREATLARLTHMFYDHPEGWQETSEGQPYSDLIEVLENFNLNVRDEDHFVALQQLTDMLNSVQEMEKRKTGKMRA